LIAFHECGKILAGAKPEALGLIIPWWIAPFPGVAIFVIVLGVTLLTLIFPWAVAGSKARH